MKEGILYKGKTHKLITTIHIVLILLGLFMIAVPVVDLLSDIQSDWFEETLLFCIQIWTIVIAVMIAVSLLLKLAKQKYFVEAERIYGKKGYKKFDISFKEILEMKKYDKTVIIKTEKTTVALSLHKNYDEICSLIEPFVPENDSATAGTSVVDDIKLF